MMNLPYNSWSNMLVGLGSDGRPAIHSVDVIQLSRGRGVSSTACSKPWDAQEIDNIHVKVD